MEEYIIALSLNRLKNDVLSSTRVDKMNKNKYHLTGNFMTVFNELVRSRENLNVNLKSSNAVMYRKFERSDTPFLRVNAYCSLCSSNCKYAILIENNQLDEQGNTKSGRDYVDCKISKHAEHFHEQPTLRLTDEERQRVVTEIQLDHKSSAKRYVLEQTAKGLEVQSEDVLRQAKSEFLKKKSMQVVNDVKIENDINVSVSSQKANNDTKITFKNKEEVLTKTAVNVKVVYSIDFQANLISVAEALKASVIGNKLCDYVWNGNCYPDLSIYLYMKTI